MPPSELMGSPNPERLAIAELTSPCRWWLRLAPAIVLLAAGAVMLIWTWGTWPDAFVDFGQRLYLPWQVSQGKVLYRDIASYNGPLSPYWNAVWFRLFGPSLRTLVVVNLVLLAGLTGLLYGTLRRVAGGVASTAGCLVFLLLFAFAQFVVNGNYNYVCPYSHELTHGIVLSIGALSCAWAYPRRGLPTVAAAGALFGLLFLTKAEVFVPGAAAVVTALVLTSLTLRQTGRNVVALAGTFVGAATLPPLMAFVGLWSQMGAPAALRGTLGSWVIAGNSQIVKLPFFQWGMGTDDVGGNLGLILAYSWWLAAVVTPAIVLGLIVYRRGLARTVAAVLIFLGTAGVLWVSRKRIEWFDVARPLPLVMLATAAVLAALLVVHRRDPHVSQRLIRQLSLTVLGGTMLAKMLLNARISDYGFVLAMPATVVMTIILLDWLPAALRRFDGAEEILTSAAAAMLAVAVVSLLSVQAQLMAPKTCQVGSGADAFRTYPIVGQAMNAAIRDLSQERVAGRTLAVLPEGAMLNYLCRRENPTPYTNFMPPEMIFFGEASILESLRGHPPDTIALVHKDTSEYGYQYFGRDYGQDIYAWIRQNYKPAATVGAAPLTGPDFGIALLERKAQ